MSGTRNPQSEDAKIRSSELSAFKYELGDQVEDIVTSLVGVVIGSIEFLNGCKQYSVKQQKLSKDGKPIEGEWIDEGQLVLKKSDVLNVRKKTTGGPATGMTLPRL